jgi:hypothetical protein
MNSKSLKSVFVIALLLAFACDEPETTVTNIIHPDGSITRRIEMKNKKNNFKVSAVQVPFDSTWTFHDSLTIGIKKDTTWFKTAEKKYKNSDELNMAYLDDKGCNRKAIRKAAFSNQFKWFFTVYRFSERFEPILKYGYPKEKFFSKEEIEFNSLPGSMAEIKLSGPDSAKYRVMKDTIDKKSERWAISSLISEWIEEFVVLVKDQGLIKSYLKRDEPNYPGVAKAGTDEEAVESLLGKDMYKKFKTEADTAVAIVNRRFDISFKEYSEKFVMPGKVIGTNGFLDSAGVVLWPVKDDCFFTAPYEIWAESKVTNIWAWVVSGLFFLFVITGLILRLKKR